MSIAKLPKVASQFEEQLKPKPERKPLISTQRKFRTSSNPPRRRQAQVQTQREKVVITLTMNPDDLDRVNEVAADLGMTRAALLNMWIQQQLKKGAVPRENDNIY